MLLLVEFPLCAQRTKPWGQFVAGWREGGGAEAGGESALPRNLWASLPVLQAHLGGGSQSTVSAVGMLWDSLFLHVCGHLSVSLSFLSLSLRLCLLLIVSPPPLFCDYFCVFSSVFFSHKLHSASQTAVISFCSPASFLCFLWLFSRYYKGLYVILTCFWPSCCSVGSVSWHPNSIFLGELIK